jgi:hypothetical protein
MREKKGMRQDKKKSVAFFTSFLFNNELQRHEKLLKNLDSTRGMDYQKEVYHVVNKGGENVFGFLPWRHSSF